MCDAFDGTDVEKMSAVGERNLSSGVVGAALTKGINHGKIPMLMGDTCCARGYKYGAGEQVENVIHRIES